MADTAKLTRIIRNVSVGALILAFCAPAIFFLFGLQNSHSALSETERRVLQGLPSFDGHPRDFTQQMDDYFEDRFGLRMLMIRMARDIRDNLGEDPPNVVYGKEDWLFLGQTAYRHEFEGVGDWDAGQVEDWVSSLTRVNAALAEQDIPFSAFIAIDKARAYPEYLPDGWREGLRRFRSSVYLHRNAQRAGLIDAEAYIMRAKASGRKVFYHRDTHWTPDGSYDLAMAIIDRFDPEKALPRYQPDPPKMQASTASLDLESMAGFETTSEPAAAMITFPPFGPEGVIRIEPSSPESPFAGQFATIRVDGLNDDGPRLVIVGDSFGDTMLPHFSPSFSEIIRIHHGAHLFDVSLEDVLAYEPDAVLYATAERQAFEKLSPFAPLK